jgi:hypothetical protein
MNYTRRCSVTKKQIAEAKRLYRKVYSKVTKEQWRRFLIQVNHER